MTRCCRCDAELSAWEVRKAEELRVSPCWCDGIPPVTPRTLANIAYAELCHRGLTQPVKVHDVIRFLSDEYAGPPPVLDQRRLVAR
jgi:hypothetical protein